MITEILIDCLLSRWVAGGRIVQVTIPQILTPHPHQPLLPSRIA